MAHVVPVSYGIYSSSLYKAFIHNQNATVPSSPSCFVFLFISSPFFDNYRYKHIYFHTFNLSITFCLHSSVCLVHILISSLVLPQPTQNSSPLPLRFTSLHIFLHGDFIVLELPVMFGYLHYNFYLLRPNFYY